MFDIPFLRPNLVKKESYLPYLEQIEASRIYSNYGPLNGLFEERVRDRLFGGTGGAVTMHNATVGLMLAIDQSRRPGGEFAIMPSFTFAATPLAAKWCGLTPYYIDIEPDTWQLDRTRLAEAVDRLGDRAAVVVPYAPFGTAIDLAPYKALLRRGIPVVVDAAASFGTTESGAHFGQGFEGAVVFSFHATKSFGVGEGGLVYSANPVLARRIRQAGNFGFSGARESVLRGLNGKMSEYTAAIALATLDAYPAKQAARRDLLGLYAKLLAEAGLFADGWAMQRLAGSVAPQFIPVLAPDGMRSQDVVAALARRSIEARAYFSPACHQQPQFRDDPRGALDVTERVAARIVSLPLWEEMDEAVVRAVVEALRGMGEETAS
ncbi:aminotransferase class I/II-fold pyridoxal phosphate-dependent enzyme [Paenibacillus sp. MWE-103]|uniref:Aminotransferase class I/II-fold pyridoxal phosphate-dependent enzyme n=1 Tax=Paenibacillus artemisiicola TaxID=1172618 RepID=A0ABS3W3J6_9BACL|nr:aminotransferase class I/II-fold pyridoxal phosphate-dependent enzyme [Paenibacillus artemisiicola]MBO7742876.1 aminotransferase class I/II-fold pyridoxal phosphate-dependent enzyme [Paenibacillus artemisiicola]